MLAGYLAGRICFYDCVSLYLRPPRSKYWDIRDAGGGGEPYERSYDKRSDMSQSPPSLLVSKDSDYSMHLTMIEFRFKCMRRAHPIA